MQKDALDRLARIDFLINHKATGTPTDLARKLNISERCVYKYITLMKDLGAPIKYAQHRNSYYYAEEGKFYIGFFADPMIALNS